MTKFTDMPNEEVERRRLASIATMRKLGEDEFQQWYQEKCDTFYWKNGRCCAGCDYWSSEAGFTGECLSAAPVSGVQVLKSMGIEWSSHTPPPGQPFTAHDHVCGAFKDDFDWTTLDEGYRRRIGALR